VENAFFHALTDGTVDEEAMDRAASLALIHKSMRFGD
jgi:hypothetical protein